MINDDYTVYLKHKIYLRIEINQIYGTTFLVHRTMLMLVIWTFLECRNNMKKVWETNRETGRTLGDLGL